MPYSVCHSFTCHSAIVFLIVKDVFMVVIIVCHATGFCLGLILKSVCCGCGVLSGHGTFSLR